MRRYVPGADIRLSETLSPLAQTSKPRARSRDGKEPLTPSRQAKRSMISDREPPNRLRGARFRSVRHCGKVLGKMRFNTGAAMRLVRAVACAVMLSCPAALPGSMFFGLIGMAPAA